MEIVLTKPIEDFIQRQIARGYADPNEVARQAFLRWMAEEERDHPPGLAEKIAEAREGTFSRYDPRRHDSLLSEIA